MRSTYKKLGSYIQEVNVRNTVQEVNVLLGVSIDKQFIPSIANTIGTDMTTYKIVKRNQFAYGPVTSRNGDKISVALLEDEDKVIISQSYKSFEIKDANELLPQYLMMWFRRPEFDRYARFMSHGSTREVFDWDEMCNIELPVPHPDKQKVIVKEYNVLNDRIALNNNLIQKLEETAQAIYKQSEEKESLLEPVETYVEINPSLYIVKGSLASYVEMSDLSTEGMCIKGFTIKRYSAGSKFQNNDTLLARITPCLENGKTGLVNFLKDEEIAFGSTEFIVMRARENVSPYWVYCLARDNEFRAHAISSMVGSSGRQRVHEDYLKGFLVNSINSNRSSLFHKAVTPLFNLIKVKNIENQRLITLKAILFSKMTNYTFDL